MNLDVSKLPIKLKLKNTTEDEIKIRLGNIFDEVVPSGDDLLVTITSSEKVTLVLKKLNQLGITDFSISGEDGGDEDVEIPDEIPSGSTISIEFKEKLDVTKFNNYTSMVNDCIEKMQAYISYRDEHEGTTDPDIIAEMERLEGEFNTAYELIATNEIIVEDSTDENNIATISLFSGEWLPVVCTSESIGFKTYVDIQSANNFKLLYSSMYPELNMDISKVTEAGWYDLVEIEGTEDEGDGMKLEPTTKPNNTIFKNISISIKGEDADVLTKDIASIFAKKIVIE